MLAKSCPVCGSAEFAPRVYENAAGTSHDGWPDLECKPCGKRFFSDSEAQIAYDAETQRQERRIQAMKRGEYMLFNPRTQSAEEIAAAFIAMTKKKKKKRDEA